jgi:hypothetical protein
VDKEPEDDDQEDQGRNTKFQDASKTVNVIFGGDRDFGSRRDQRLLLREIMSIEPAVPQPFRWSKDPISFSRDDQWTSFSEPGKFPLVLDPVVAEVTFGMRENYRTEFIKFEVANFESSYHTILGRPALAKFMVVPNYVYLLLKIPGLSGVLTLRGDLKKSYDCNQEAIQYASTTRVPDASGDVLTAVQQLSQFGLEIPSRKASKLSIQSTDDVALKSIQLQVGDSSKTAVIGAGLGEK